MTAAARGPAQRWASLPPGTVEAVKWLALLLMVVGHANTVLFDRQWAWPNEVGRAAFPAFAFAFGYALSRVQQARRAEVFPRVLARLLGVGLLSTPLVWLAFGTDGWLPLNILFTFAAGLVLVWGTLRADPTGVVVASVVFVLAGALVEFMWPGVLLVLAMWASFARPGVASQLLVFACLLALWPVNGNAYALLVYPLVLVVSLSRLELPRVRWLFYAAYPLHLLALSAIRHAWAALA